MKFSFKKKKWTWFAILLISLFLLIALYNVTIAIYYYRNIVKNINSGNLENAEKYLIKLDQAFPENSYITALKADYYFYHAKNHIKAIYYYERKLSQSYDLESNRNLCLAHDFLYHKEEAVVCYLKYLKNNPSDYESLFRVGMLYYDLGDLNNAIYFTNKAYEIKPDCKTAAYMVELNYINFDFSDAKKWCQQLEYCTNKELKIYPLEDFVFDLCFDDRSQENK